MQAFDYHNKGNEYYKLGEFKKALDYYNKSLKFSPYLETYFNRGLAHTRLKEYDAAIVDLQQVLKLDPHLSEGHYTLGLIYEYKKDNNLALKCYDEAINSDSTYDKADKQRLLLYLKCIRLKAEDISLCDFLIKNKNRIKSAKLREIIDSKLKSLSAVAEAFERPSCDIRSCNLCCYFKDDPWNYAVMIEPEKLDALKNFLKDNKLRFEDYVGKIKYDMLSEEQKGSGVDKKKYRIKEESNYYIYYPKMDTANLLGKERSKDKLKSLDNDEVDWVTDESSLCKFNKDMKCRIHTMGAKDKPGLDVCRQWICLPAYVISVLKALGVIDSDVRKQLTIGQINKISKKMVTFLYHNVYSVKSLDEVDKSRLNKLKQAVNSGSEDDFINYLACEEEYNKILADCIANLRIELENTLSAMDS